MGEVPLCTESTGWPAVPASESVTSKVSTGASKSVYQARPRSVAFSKKKAPRFTLCSILSHPFPKGIPRVILLRGTLNMVRTNFGQLITHQVSFEISGGRAVWDDA